MPDYIGEADRITDITVAIDKLDKIGIEAVNAELSSKGLSAEAISNAPACSAAERRYIAVKLDKLSKLLSESETGMKGICRIKTLFALY